MNEDMRRIIAGINIHMKDVQRLCEEMKKRYGIEVIAVHPEMIYGCNSIQVKRGFMELREGIGNCEPIEGSGNHYAYKYGDIEICTVTNGGKRFLKAAKRNNKWTNNGGTKDGKEKGNPPD